MKKYVIIFLSACLFLIALIGIFIFSEYKTRIDREKELLVSYTSNARMQIRNAVTQINELPYIIKDITGKDGLADRVTDAHADQISLLENFYAVNGYFIKGVSIYDRYGDVLNISRDTDSLFIFDDYKARVVSVLRSEKSVVEENNTFSYILPVYHGDTLAKNVAVGMDYESMIRKMFEPYPEKDGIWLTAVIRQDAFLTQPEGNGYMLSNENSIAKEMEVNNTGFLYGEMQNGGRATSVLSYYERVPVSGQFFGIVFSRDISRIILSSVLAFVLGCAVLLGATAGILLVLYRTVIRNSRETSIKDQQISLMQATYRDMPVGILISKQGLFYAANSCAFRLLEGYVSANDLNRNMSEIVFPAGFYSDSRREFQDGYLCSFEHKGREVHLSWKQTGFEANGVGYAVDTFWDITEMEQSRRNAIRSEIAKSELLSRISTDFKKPLSSIEDTVVLLKQKYPDESGVLNISNFSAKLSDLINDVQDFADIESGRIVPDEIPFNIVGELKKAADAYQQQAQQKGIGFQVQIAASAVRNLVGDPQRFRQVLDQLLSNAVRFTKEGEIRVSLETTSLQDGKVLVKCSVEDTGQGMSKQKIKNLFSLDLRANKAGESIGLGVIIVKKLVGIMGGSIKVNSPSHISTSPDAPGVQFSLTIQCYSDQPFDKQLDYSHIFSPGKLNVLIISSGIHHVQYLGNFLKGKGIQADFFTCNKDSSELLINKLIIDRTRYQMAIIEAANSETNFAIAHKIHERGLTGQCLYVLIDSYHQKGNYLKARSLNVDYYFVRNESLSSLNAVLREHFVNLSEAKRNFTDLRKNINILIAENNSLSQSVARLVFKQAGYEADFANNTLEMINLMNNKTYDIIFIDLKIPPNDGFETVDILRQKGYKLPVIAMTSTLTRENIKKISDSGMNGYVAKPLSTESIKNALLKWVV